MVDIPLSKEVKEFIHNSFYIEGLSFSRIRFLLQDNFNLKVFDLQGRRVINLGGFPEKFLKIIGVKNWSEYEKEHKKIYARLASKKRHESGFTATLKKKIKKKYNNQCALCELEKRLYVHHIDEDLTNNDEINLIPLCNNHHKPFTHNKCIVCNRHLKEIGKGIIINEKDISELEDCRAIICPNHPITFKIYCKDKVIDSFLHKISEEIYKNNESPLQREIRALLMNIEKIKDCSFKRTPFEFPGETYCFFNFDDSEKEFEEYCKICGLKNHLASEKLFFMKCKFFKQEDWDVQYCTHPEFTMQNCLYFDNLDRKRKKECKFFNPD